MNDPDLRDPDLRVLECTACDGPIWGYPTGTVLRVPCGYCGAENVRELAPPAKLGGSDEPYRHAAPPRAKPLQLDFEQTPAGISRLSGAPELRAAIRSAKAELPGDERADVDAIEHRLSWASFALANALLAKKDVLRARALLESTYELSLHPVRRALVAARIARTAALQGAGDVAERWLARVPADVRVAEIAGEARLARVLLARAAEDPDAMLGLLGAEDSWPASARHLAMALRCDALERKGDLRAARQVYRRAARGAALAFNATIRTHALAPRTLRRTEHVGFVALGLIVVVLAAGALALNGQPLAALGLFACCLVGVGVLRLF